MAEWLLKRPNKPPEPIPIEHLLDEPTRRFQLGAKYFWGIAKIVSRQLIPVVKKLRHCRDASNELTPRKQRIPYEVKELLAIFNVFEHIEGDTIIESSPLPYYLLDGAATKPIRR
jgi:hypothetical protein